MQPSDTTAARAARVEALLAGKTGRAATWLRRLLTHGDAATADRPDHTENYLSADDRPPDRLAA
jgi:hypothetical protein